jgi:hypothetical protein
MAHSRGLDLRVQFAFAENETRELGVYRRRIGAPRLSPDMEARLA